MYGSRGYAPPPPWNPPRRPAVNPAVLVVAIVLGVFLVLAVVILLAFSSLGGALFLEPFCFIFLILIVTLIAVAAGASRRTSLPPPPPIQQPMVPAGMEGPIAVNCPNCGAPPGSIDRFGVAICTHCGTRFLVR